MNERDKQDIDLLEAREDPTKARESAEQPLDFITSLVNLTVVLLGDDASAQRHHRGGEAKIQRQLARLVTLTGATHEQMDGLDLLPELSHQLASCRRIMRLTRRQRKSRCRSSIHGNHMNLCGPSASGLADGLWTVLLTHRCHQDEP